LLLGRSRSKAADSKQRLYSFTERYRVRTAFALWKMTVKFGFASSLSSKCESGERRVSRRLTARRWMSLNWRSASSSSDVGRGVYFYDPNGHLFELITRPYGANPEK
jgi:catechol 2,3-dioxygenase-like lactoylglutathione lyase family enzyme